VPDGNDDVDIDGGFVVSSLLFDDSVEGSGEGEDVSERVIVDQLRTLSGRCLYFRLLSVNLEHKTALLGEVKNRLHVGPIIDCMILL